MRGPRARPAAELPALAPPARLGAAVLACVVVDPPVAAAPPVQRVQRVQPVQPVQRVQPVRRRDAPGGLRELQEGAPIGPLATAMLEVAGRAGAVAVVAVDVPPPVVPIGAAAPARRTAGGWIGEMAAGPSVAPGPVGAMLGGSRAAEPGSALPVGRALTVARALTESGTDTALMVGRLGGAMIETVTARGAPVVHRRVRRTAPTAQQRAGTGDRRWVSAEVVPAGVAEVGAGPLASLGRAEVARLVRHRAR